MDGDPVMSLVQPRRPLHRAATPTSCNWDLPSVSLMATEVAPRNSLSPINFHVPGLWISAVLLSAGDPGLVEPTPYVHRPNGAVIGRSTYQGRETGRRRIQQVASSALENSAWLLPIPRFIRTKGSSPAGTALALSFA
jgi:hypothetical protein